jgi:hypothetical protein
VPLVLLQHFRGNDAVCAWGIPDHALLQRLSAIEVPTFVANGDRDPMILPRYSYLLARQLSTHRQACPSPQFRTIRVLRSAYGCAAPRRGRRRGGRIGQ